MKEICTKPKELFDNYVANKVSKTEALDRLLFLIENDDSPLIRSESLKIIEKIGLEDGRFFNIIESSLVSDDDPFVRAIALEVLIQNFLDRSETLFFWLVHNETSAVVLYPLLKYLDKTSNEKGIEYKDIVLRKFASMYEVVIDEAEFFLEWEYLYSKNNEDGKYVEIGWFFEEGTQLLHSVKHGEGSDLRAYAVKDYHVVALDLSYKNLKVVPESVRLLRQLTFFRIDGVKEIPDFLRKLPHLRELYVRGPFTQKMPDWLLLRIKKKYLFSYIVEGVNHQDAIVLGLLEYFIGTKIVKIPINYSIKDKDYEAEYKINEDGNIVGIYININHRIGGIPVEIGSLKYLRELIFDGGCIELIPDSIGNLTFLKYLKISFGNIKEIPKSISNLKSLEYLNLSQHKIEKIPKYITKLKTLKILNLGDNKLNEIPDSLCNVNSLEELYLENNKIKEIPEKLKQLTNLHLLYLYENPIEIIPETVKSFVKSLDDSVIG